MNNLIEFPAVLILPVLIGFIAVGKTRWTVMEVSDPLFYLMTGVLSCCSLYSLCFSLGKRNTLPCSQIG